MARTRPQPDRARARLPPVRPARPLVAIAAVLVAGSLLGAAALRPAFGPASWPASVGPWLGLALLFAALFFRPSLRARAPLLGTLLVLSFLRALALEPRAESGPFTREEMLAAREEVIFGRLRLHRSSGGRRFLIEAAPGRSLGPAARVLFEPLGPMPASGAWIAVLPGSAVVPLPRGPVRGPLARTSGIDATSPVRVDELVVLAAPEASGPLARLAVAFERSMARLRSTLAHRARSLSEDPRVAGLLAATFVGDMSGIDAETSDLLTRTGTRHLLAVSGTHVALFFVLVVVPLAGLLAPLVERAFPRRGPLALALAQGLALVFYAALAGAGAPAERAALSFALALLARHAPHASHAHGASGERARYPDAWTLLSLALSLEALADPLALRELSLELSYLATAGLVLGTRALTRHLRALWPEPREPLAPTFIGALLHALWVRTRRASVGALAASAVAVLATLPIAWSIFGEFSPLGLLATPLALVPFAGMFLAAGAGALAPMLAPLLPGEAFTGLFLALLQLIDRLPGTPELLPTRPAWLLMLLAGSTLAALARPERRPRWAVRALLAAWGILLMPWSAAPATLEIHALEVGHGTCVVMRGPGVPALVFDAGSRDRRGIYEEALEPLLLAWEAPRPWVVLSHTHLDHGAALPRLVERAPPHAWLGALPAHTPLRIPRATHAPELERGAMVLAPSDQIRLRLLRGAAPEGNEGSFALEVSAPGLRAVFFGDAEEAGLRAVLEALAPGPCSLVLMPHHGSDLPALGELLARLDPREVWISASRAPPVLPELERRGVRTSWTGRDGPLALGLRSPAPRRVDRPEESSWWPGRAASPREKSATGPLSTPIPSTPVVEAR